MDKYKRLSTELECLISKERDAIANMSNFSALLFNGLENINWAGFYILKDKQLVLGPFQGKPACIRIDIGKGVCGTAALEKRTIVVEDVNKFPGHIVCDSYSKSEIVIPLISNGKLIGVLDIDSPVKNRFGETDKKELENMVELFTKLTDLTDI
jgi:GAF domain-containing protein